MSTHAILALQAKLDEAKEDLANQEAADADRIQEGKRAQQRVDACQRIVADLEQGIAALEAIYREGH